MAVFQPLAMLAWREELPGELSNGQVRAALTAVMKRMYGDEWNFNEGGFLTLGLPADHPFRIVQAEYWTQRKAWGGKDFPKDHAIK